jgi:DNA helicase II / ATP-dependent DNA helicase PcrA
MVRDGCYTNARAALDAALAQDQLLEGVEAPWGLQVMTFHKSKAKQFDGVIVVREARKSGESFVSSFVRWGDEHPHTRSRRILRVGITRAKFHTVILDPVNRATSRSNVDRLRAIVRRNNLNACRWACLRL